MKTVKTPYSSADEKDRFTVYNPATGKPIAEVWGGSAETVDAAVKKAEETFNTKWRYYTAEQRGRLLYDCSRIVYMHREELARLEAEEMGKPYTQAMGDVLFCVGAFEMFAGYTNILPSSAKDQGATLAISTLEPFGVVGGIIPFNWPPIHTAGKVAPALAVGNCVVIKPPEQDPFTIMRIVELLNTILPEGVVTAVPGLGHVGAAIAGHPKIRMLSFTGSPFTGKAVLKTTADNLIPTIMELGGKNGIVVFEDADLEQVARDIIEAAFFNQGEACTAASRIIVHRSLHDRLVEMLIPRVEKLIVGDPQDEKTHVGPLVTDIQKKRVLDYIDIGLNEGAKIIAKAKLPGDEKLKDGYFVVPTLFTNVTPDMRIAKEEIFGPVLAIIPFDTYEEAIEIANGTDFGLVAGIYSNDFKTCWRASRDIQAGMVLVNNYFRATIALPFGGCKHSGFGREHNLDTLREFGYVKTTKFTTGVGKIPEWFAVSDVCDK